MGRAGKGRCTGRGRRVQGECAAWGAGLCALQQEKIVHTPAFQQIKCCTRLAHPSDQLRAAHAVLRRFRFVCPGEGQLVTGFRARAERSTGQTLIRKFQVGGLGAGGLVVGGWGQRMETRAALVTKWAPAGHGALQHCSALQHPFLRGGGRTPFSAKQHTLRFQR